MSDTIVDVQVEFDIMLLSKLFELIAARPNDPASEKSGILTLLYSAALLSEQGLKIEDAEFVRMAQEALEQARSASKNNPPRPA